MPNLNPLGLDKLVKDGLLSSYEFQLSKENISTQHPYDRIELVFPNGVKVIIMPEDRHDGLSTDKNYLGLGLYVEEKT